jgi:hypothetical protein
MTRQEQVRPSGRVLVRDWAITFAACLMGILVVRVVVGPSAVSPVAMIGVPALIATVFLGGRLVQKK